MNPTRIQYLGSKWWFWFISFQNHHFVYCIYWFYCYRTNKCSQSGCCCQTKTASTLLVLVRQYWTKNILGPIDRTSTDLSWSAAAIISKELDHHPTHAATEPSWNNKNKILGPNFIVPTYRPNIIWSKY